jgi:hypothetical protein
MTNQEIKRKLVDREVIYNVNELMDELSRTHMDEFLEKFCGYDYKEPVGYHIDNEMTVVEAMDWLIDECGEMPYTGNAKDQLKRYLDDHNLYNEFADDEGIEGDPVEIFEYYIVTEWFGRKLKEYGEIVEDFFGLTVWGRQCSGQAILLDGVIDRIANDMEILVGQENEWK